MLGELETVVGVVVVVVVVGGGGGGASCCCCCEAAVEIVDASSFRTGVTTAEEAEAEEEEAIDTRGGDAKDKREFAVSLVVSDASAASSIVATTPDIAGRMDEWMDG